MPVNPVPHGLHRDPGQVLWYDPAMPIVESRRACQSRACYKEHLHPTFSIGAIDAGQSTFTGADGGPVVLSPGTLVFVPAGRMHACNPASGSAWSYQMLHLDAEWLRGVRDEYCNEAKAKREPVRIVTNPKLYAHFNRLNSLLFTDADPSDKEARLIEFIGDTETEQGRSIGPADIPQKLVELIKPALEYLHRMPSKSISLGELAGLVRLSRYQLIRAFRIVTGMTPHAWQVNHRINLSRTLLRDGDSISSVALALGFADQAHFQRAFKAHTGVTPGRFCT